VVGTTGWYENYEEVAKEVMFSRGAMLAATNFSLGVNLFFSLNEWLAKTMVEHPEYAVRVDETHHVHKQDAPSGTAISIAERLLLHLDKKNWSLNGQQPETIPIFAHRIDEVPGTHEVRFAGPYDEIKLVHTAHNRRGFASGALVAAEWLLGKTGVFSMRDVLGI
jgi:4-hydroxy-tetrahydrodipicolinate reductase